MDSASRQMNEFALHIGFIVFIEGAVLTLKNAASTSKNLSARPVPQYISETLKILGSLSASERYPYAPQATAYKHKITLNMRKVELQIKHMPPNFAKPNVTLLNPQCLAFDRQFVNIKGHY